MAPSKAFLRRLLQMIAEHPRLLPLLFSCQHLLFTNRSSASRWNAETSSVTLHCADLPLKRAIDVLLARDRHRDTPAVSIPNKTLDPGAEAIERHIRVEDATVVVGINGADFVVPPAAQVLCNESLLVSPLPPPCSVQSIGTTPYCTAPACSACSCTALRPCKAGPGSPHGHQKQPGPL